MTLEVRKFRINEVQTAAELIYSTVHTVCAPDYTQTQLDAWAPKNMDILRLLTSLARNYTLVAMMDGKMVGIISTESDGYVNRLFTHQDYLNRGVASALLEKTQKWAKNRFINRLTLEASDTAIEFYLKHGFYITGSVQKVRNGVDFINTTMAKDL